MRARRTTALLAGTIAAFAGLTLAPTVVAQAATTSVAHQASAHPAPAPKPTKTRDPYQQGQVDGRSAGKADGADCNYRQSYAPHSGASKYVQAYKDAYERNYDATCDED
ncbi:hypothetical protein [Streptomyces sp. NPDC093970]|uniref:hypothetical protein n=1 Tax=Streptomyces sp. NPDC093970 TaxID=3155076 RepID=UPI003432E585